MGTEAKAAMRRVLESLAALPAAEWEDFARCLQPAKLSTGDAFLRVGEPSGKAGFVVSGLVKAFYRTSEGDEYIRSFSTEGSFLIALAALLSGRAESDVTFVALEPTEVLVFSWADYRSRLTRHVAWQQIGRLMTEHVYLLRERRQWELLTLGAEQRLAAFMTQFPGLAARISQKDLAAYIGITPVSLSRLRAQLGARP